MVNFGVGRLLAFMAFSISYTTPTRWLHVWAILTIMTPLIAFITSRWFSSALLLDDDEDEDDVDVIAGVVPRARHSSLVGMSFVMSTLSDPPVDGVGVLSVGPMAWLAAEAVPHMGSCLSPLVRSGRAWPTQPFQRRFHGILDTISLLS